jgi:hypothetical protein
LKTKPEDRMNLENAEKHPWIKKNYFEPMQKRLDEKENNKFNNLPEDIEI